jgi:tetratricopeptide (TPR) repeat protein
VVSNDDPETAFQRDPSDESSFRLLERRHRDRAEWRLLAGLYEQHASAVADEHLSAELLWKASQAYRRLDDVDSERRVLSRAVALTATDERTLTRLAELAEAEKRWAEFLRCLAAKIDLVNTGAGSELARASLHCRSAHVWLTQCHRIDKAIDHYRLALASDPRNTEALGTTRQILRSIGQWNDVADLCRFELDSITNARRKVEILLELGQLLRDQLRQPEQAVAAYGEAAKLRPADDTIGEQLAELYASAEWPNPGGLEQAAALFLRLAQRREARDDREGAIAYYRRALGANPQHNSAARRLQRAYEELQRWEDLERLYQHRLAFVSERDALELQRRRAELLHERLDRPAEAAKCYEALLAQDVPGSASWLSLRQIYRKLGQHRELADLLARQADSTRKRSKRADLLLEAATLHYEELGDPERAARLWRQVLELQPGHPEALAGLEAHLAHRGDYRQLAQLIEYALESSPLAKASPLEICEYLEKLAQIQERQLGDLDAAKATWDRVARLHPDRSRAAAPLRNLDVRSRRIERQLQELEQEQRHATSTADRLRVLKLVGATLHDLGVEQHLAVEALREATENDPSDDASLVRLANLYRKRSDLDGLAWVLHRRLDGILTRPERVEVLRELGAIELSRERTREAITAHQELLQLAPTDEDAFRALCRLLEQTEDLEQLGRVLERHATGAASTAERIDAFRQLGELMSSRLEVPEKAIDAWESVIALDPADSEAPRRLIELYDRCERADDLLALLRRQIAAVVDDDERVSLLRRATHILHDQSGQRDEAIRYSEEVARLRPRDPTAWSALATLYEQDARHLQLVEALARLGELSDDSSEKIALAFRQIDVFENYLVSPERAIDVYEQVLATIDPGNIEAHRRLKLLQIGRGRYEAAILIAERELFLAASAAEGPPTALDLALEIAELWQQKLHDTDRAMLAFERVLDIQPESRIAREALHQLYLRADAYLPLVDLAPLLLENLDSTPQRHALMIEMATLWETKLGDVTQAFDWYARAYALSGDAGAAHTELQRLARDHRLWTSLLSLYQQTLDKTSEPTDRSNLYRRMEQIACDELDDPARALRLVRQAIDDQSGDLTGLVERAEEIARGAALHEDLYQLYLHLFEQADTVERKVTYLRRAAALAEEELDDHHRAAEQQVRAYRLAPSTRDDEAYGELIATLERIALEHQHSGPLLYLLWYQLKHSTEAAERFELLCELAQLYEHKLGDAPRAFSAMLHALMLGFDTPALREHLWRLAATLTDSTDQISSDLFDPQLLQHVIRQTDPEHVARAETTASPPGSPPPPPSDPTQTQPRAPNATNDADEGGLLELSSLDIVELDETTDALLSDLPVQVPPPSRAGTPWKRLEAALQALGGSRHKVRAQQGLKIAQMWECGAGDAERALEALADAALLDPELDQALDEMERLAEQHGWLDRLMGRYADLIDQAADGDCLVRLHRRAAAVLSRNDKLEPAEQHLAAALSARPDDFDSTAALQQLYAKRGNWDELTRLLERRLSDEAATLSAEERRALADELADIYHKRLDDPARAASTLTSVAQDQRGDRELVERLAQLYHEASAWSKQVEWLEQLRQLTADTNARCEIDLKLGQIFENELELPGEAIEAYRRAAAPAETPSAADRIRATALDRLEALYRQHDRHEELIATLRERSEMSTTSANEKRALLLEAAALLQARGALDEAIETLEQARQGEAADDDLEEQLAEILRTTDRARDAAQLLEDRLKRLERADVPADRLAATLVALGSIWQNDLSDPTRAHGYLEQAVLLVPAHSEGLALLAENQATTGNWEQFAKTSQQLAALEVDTTAAATRLTQAAARLSAHLPESARALLDQALECEPEHRAAIDTLLALCHEPHRRRELLQLKLSLSGSDEERALVHSQLGDVLTQLDPLSEEALGAYQQGCQLAPQCVEPVEGLSRALFTRGELDEARACIEDAVERLKGGANASRIGMLYFRLGTIHDARDEHDLAYRNLLEARRLLPKDLDVQLALGQNRFRTRRWREALRYLGKADEHPDASGARKADVASALYNAGLCERRLRRPGRALPLFEAALGFNPEHPGALRELAEASRIAGSHERTAELQARLASVSPSSRERISLLASAAQLYGETLRDPQRAFRCRQRLARDLVDSNASSIATAERVELLEQLLPNLQRSAPNLETPAVAHALAQLSPAEETERRLSYLLLAAKQYELNEEWNAADACRREALAVDPHNDEAVAGLARALRAREQPEQLKALIEEHLNRPRKTGAPPNKPSLGELHALLGYALSALGQPKEAVVAFERSLRLREDIDVRLHLAELYRQMPKQRVAALSNYRILARDVTQVGAIEALAQAALKSAPYRAFCLYEVLALVGKLDTDGRSFLDTYEPPQVAADEPFGGVLSDAERRTALAPQHGSALDDVLTTIWEAAPLLFDRTLREFGTDQDHRISPLDEGNLARVFSALARALEIKNTGLYLRTDVVAQQSPPDIPVVVAATAPPSVIVSPEMLEYPLDRMRFILGRALDLSQPPNLLAVGLAPREFAELIGDILRAFHPRHVRSKGVSQEARQRAERLRRKLPYKTARRLGELFRERPDAPFDSSRWREAVRLNANRVALALSGNLRVAWEQLLQEEPELRELPVIPDAIQVSRAARDLISFAVSDGYYICRVKLGAAGTG